MANRDLHEGLRRRHAVEGGSDRSFGLIVGAILAAIGAIRAVFAGAPGTIDYGLLGLGGMLMLFGLVAPAVLSPLNRGWTRLGLLMFKVVNPLVLGLIYLGAFVPTGLAMRAFGKDPLRLRRQPEAATYWIERAPPGPPPESLKDQF